MATHFREAGRRETAGWGENREKGRKKERLNDSIKFQMAI